jgi:serine/threonine protein kinase
MVYHLLTGERPFFGRNVDELQKNIERGMFKIPSNMDFSLECISFVTACLKSDSRQRLDWDQLLAHPFLSGDSHFKIGCR